MNIFTENCLKEQSLYAEKVFSVVTLLRTFGAVITP